MLSTLFKQNPIFGRHAPLILGWSDEQLQPLVERLMPLLPGTSTERMRLAVASVARSLVVEKVSSGAGVHYARGKDPYSRPRRYRDQDSLATWYFITHSVDLLEAVGLVEQALGFWCRGGGGRQSVAWATDDLVSLLVPLIDIHEGRAVPATLETIVLRDGTGKKVVDYPETADTNAMREQVQIINENLAQLDLHLFGTRRDMPVGRRIFNGSFDRGGRFYFLGWSPQNMPVDERRQLKLLIDGHLHPVVEIDFSALHIRMAYAEAGQPIPAGDPYAIDGFSRGLVKKGVNTLLNAPTRNSGVLGIAKELLDDPFLKAENDIRAPGRAPCRALAERLVVAIQEKHCRIEDYFGSDCGARFQRQDSDMAMEIMIRMIQRTGRCPVPIHDSFVVAAIDADVLSRTMTEVAGEYGLDLILKDSRYTEMSLNPPPPSPPLLHL